MRSVRIVQALVVCLTTAFLVGVLVLNPDTDLGQRAGLEVVPVRPGGPAGTAFLERAPGRERLAGTLVVWRLAPGSRHFATLRGPGRRCELQITQPLPELRADANGVAFARIDVPLLTGTFSDGLALTVHADADRRSPAVACGTAPGGRRLAR